MATIEEIEAACRGMYGKNWDGPDDKMPGEKMKDVWRKYARLAIEAVDAIRTLSSLPQEKP